ncbi:MAG: YggU family protein [Rhodocyclales bacterium]|nr:YggU family protein [Rhodocyclales bacterium]
MTACWLRREASGSLVLSLHVQPGAKKTEIVGLHGEALKIRLAAPPVDGKANESLVEFLAEQLEVPRAQVELIGGATSRQKRLRVRGASDEAIARLLLLDRHHVEGN